MVLVVGSGSVDGDDEDEGFTGGANLCSSLCVPIRKSLWRRLEEAIFSRLSPLRFLPTDSFLRTIVLKDPI